jgi:ubiquinone/menaquinone biosynthesis C-methylase UbiE
LATFPEYYRRNFHYQTDGYLSDHSAKLYDQQVEVLFMGSADAMRRQALVPLAMFLRDRRIADTRLLDVACGTGRFLTFVKDNYPRLPVVALDLSPNYLAEARAQLKGWPDVGFIQGLAETLPFPDESFDVLTSVYLLHEVPDDIRRRILAEAARVLRPGGRLILVDSLQLGDRPYFDIMVKNFPRSFHEPYYAGYARTDFAALATGVGLRYHSSELAFLSKVITLDKP